MKRESTTTAVKLKTGGTVTIRVEKRSLGPIKNVAKFVKKNNMVAR